MSEQKLIDLLRSMPSLETLHVETLSLDGLNSFLDPLLRVLDISDQKEVQPAVPTEFVCPTLRCIKLPRDATWDASIPALLKRARYLTRSQPPTDTDAMAEEIGDTTFHVVLHSFLESRRRSTRHGGIGVSLRRIGERTPTIQHQIWVEEALPTPLSCCWPP